MVVELMYTGGTRGSLETRLLGSDTNRSCESSDEVGVHCEKAYGRARSRSGKGATCICEAAARSAV